jgi:hypothetical protein
MWLTSDPTDDGRPERRSDSGRGVSSRILARVAHQLPGAKRRLPGQTFIDHRAERKDVGGWRDLALAPRLLGGHIVEGAERRLAAS